MFTFVAKFEWMIQADNISKRFGNIEVLRNVSLRVHPAELVSVVGASGAGKTTLLQIIGTLLKCDSGKLTIQGTNVSRLNERELAAFRNQSIGFVFQFHHLLPEFSALENICIPAFIAGKNRKEAELRAMELLDFFKLRDRANHKPSELSGGEQQRVAVARALVNRPAVVLADEPSGNLDSASANALHQLFFDLRNEFQQTFVIVTHNPQLAQMADRRILISDGQISDAGNKTDSETFPPLTSL